MTSMTEDEKTTLCITLRDLKAASIAVATNPSNSVESRIEALRRINLVDSIFEQLKFELF